MCRSYVRLVAAYCYGCHAEVRHLTGPSCLSGRQCHSEPDRWKSCILSCIRFNVLVAWLSGWTSVSGRRTFPVLRSTCSWWVTTNVGKPSATGQPTRPTQPFILSGSIIWVVSWNQMCAVVYRWRHLVKATKVNAGLAESNGRLLLGIWRDSLHVTFGLTACTPGSAPGPTLGNEYGKTLPFLHKYKATPVVLDNWKINLFLHRQLHTS